MSDPRPPRFRPDIQGLRALAVLTVLAAHAGLPFFDGGYVGVDIFFVISGFLISQLLFREVGRTGRMSLGAFYARRARRILPAATLVTLVTVVASMIWLSAIDAVEVVTDAWWSTFFAANIRFADVGTDYFSSELGPSPMRHYWSLAVEEQFYVLWPLLLLGCLALARLRRGSLDRDETGVRRQRLPKLIVFYMLMTTMVISFAYSIWRTADDPTAAYFSTPARAWELALGGVTALVAPAVGRRLTRQRRGAIAGLGLVAIGVACLAYDSTTPFPGLAAVLPVGGAAALLLAGAGTPEEHPAAVRALSVRPLRAIGDWSFSLYLWHWPLLVIPRQHLGRELTLSETGLAVLGALTLAALTHRFVETPFRTTRRFTRRGSLLLAPISIATVASVCLAGTLYNQYRVGAFDDTPAITTSNFGVEAEDDFELAKDEAVSLVQASAIAARNKMQVPADLSPPLLELRSYQPDLGACDYTDDMRSLCPGGDPAGDKTMVVLGNSHGRMWQPALEEIAKQQGYRTYHLVKSNCTAADVGVGDLDDGGSYWEECTSFRDWAFAQIERLQPDLTIVSTSPPNPIIYDDQLEPVERSDADRWAALTRQGYLDTFAKLDATSDRVVLIRDIPKNTEDPGECLTTGNPDLGDCVFTPLDVNEWAADISVEAAKVSSVPTIDPRPWLCFQGKCPVVIGNLLPYRDVGHLSTVYAKYLAPSLTTALEQTVTQPLVVPGNVTKLDAD